MENNVIHKDFRKSFEGGGTSGGEPPMDEISERVRKLEDTCLEIKSTMATRDDVHMLQTDIYKSESSIKSEMNTQTYKNVGLMSLIIAVFYFVIKFSG